MRWVLNVLFWLVMTIEVQGGIFAGLWSTPLTPISTILFTPVAHVYPWDAMLLVVWGISFTIGGARVPAVGRSLKITIGALVATWLWGVLHAGTTYQAIFQLHSFALSLFVATAVAAVYRTRADFVSLGRTIASACVYRSLTAVGFWFFVAKDLKEPPIAMTEHTDTVLFVIGMFLFIVNFFEKKTVLSGLLMVLGLAPIIGGIIVNNRRLAWLCVGVAFVLMYLLLPKGKQKKKINRILLLMSPAIAAYIAVGWGNPTGIFKPVGSISTMFGDHQDTSSMMRDIENYNLMVTLKSSPLMGIGWGAEYIEQLRAIDISQIFPQYRYMPHNSLLGVIAFTGMLGFAGIWQMVLVAVYFHTLVYRNTKVQAARVASMVALIGVLVIELQCWGDIGFNHPMVCCMLAIIVGSAARLPIMAGVYAPAAAATPPVAAGAAAPATNAA
jgi:hypothetical protein